MARTNHRVNKDKSEDREFVDRKRKRRNKRANRQRVDQAIRNGDWDALEELED